MVSRSTLLFVLLQVFLMLQQVSVLPTPAASTDADQSVSNRQLTEERPLQEQMAEADSLKAAVQSADSQAQQPPEESHPSDDFTMLQSLADRQKPAETLEVPVQKADQFLPDESDSTKSRRLVDDYDSTKNRMDYGKYQDDPETFRQVDGTPLTAEDIVQKIANKIYEEDDRGVFDRIVTKLLKLGLITENQADTLEYQVAEALQDLITKNAKDNEIEDVDQNQDQDQDTGGEQDDQSPDPDTWEPPRRRYNEDEEDEEEDEDDDEDEVDRDAEKDAEDDTWVKDGDGGNEVNPGDGLQDLQYFPNFYRLLKSLNSDRDVQERETLITIMKTLIDFVKMMVKYGTITPEEGVSYLENLDAMIAMQTRNKLGKALGLPEVSGPGLEGRTTDEEDNTKSETAKMQKEYENLRDSTKEEQPSTETNQPGRSETYLEAIRKNIEWLKKHNKDGGKDDYDLSKLKDFMDQQVDSYIEKGIIAKDEGDTIKRIYSSL
ncbi:secretogranin-3 [Austrofundulus limnaeus]|uniref:Secretogranin-3 n=1 Tax=Austrofundulus limnaeus TaxID=52670 RepID=A0A2I4CQ52_AUSLI|nr:PREDICTED: secretogranin-3 [Austrofundulus limnaeus]